MQIGQRFRYASPSLSFLSRSQPASLPDEPARARGVVIGDFARSLRANREGEKAEIHTQNVYGHC